MKEEKVIKFEPKGFALKLKKKKTLYCDHKQVWVNEDTRLLKCRKCGCVVDPFDYIYRWAIEEWRIGSDIKYLEKKQSQLYDEIERLKKEARNAKNRLKRAQKKLFEEKN